MIRALSVLSLVAAMAGIAATFGLIPSGPTRSLFGTVSSPTLIVAGAITFALSAMLDRDA